MDGRVGPWRRLSAKELMLLVMEVCLVKAMVFPVVVYGCESWTVKKAERQIIDAFELWCWRRLLRVPWTSRRSNQSTLKEINPDYSSEGLMLSLQYSGHLMRRTDSLEDLDAGKDWRQEEKGTKEDEMSGWYHEFNGMNLSKLQEMVKDKEAWLCFSPWGLKESDMTEQE